MTNLEYIRSLNDKLFTMSYENICRIVYSIGHFGHAIKPDKCNCNDCSSCIDSFLKEEYNISNIFYYFLDDYIKEKLCMEPDLSLHEL